MHPQGSRRNVISNVWGSRDNIITSNLPRDAKIVVLEFITVCRALTHCQSGPDRFR
jgi:hypothetical protein